MRILFSSCLIALFAGVSGTEGQPKEKPKAKQTLEQAYRSWYTAFFFAKTKEDREKALHAMMPRQEDMEYLFPKDALTMLYSQFLSASGNLDKIAKEIADGGEIRKIETIDVRTDKRRREKYQRALEIIPKDVPVFEIVVHRMEKSSSSGAYLYLHNRWFWIKDLDLAARFAR